MARSLRRAAAIGGALLTLSCVSMPLGSASAAAARPTQDEQTERQVMVTYRPAPPSLWSQTTSALSRNYRLRVVFSWTLASLGEHCVVFEAPANRSARDLVTRLASDPRVGSAQTIEKFETLVGDPYAHLQHSSQALRLDQAHRWATGKGVRVAVVDTGVDLDHPDLRGRIIKAQNFVDRGERTFTTDIHGTAVAGLIAAGANNEVGIVGVAPGAEVYALKACWQQPPTAREAVCNSYTLAKAVDFAINQGAQVLNFSLAGPPDPLLGRLIGHALSKGIVVVAADGGAARDFPASYQGVIGIRGSEDPKGGPAAATEHGRTSSLAAPAVDILTTVPRSSYDFFSGSSLAAAQVSGVAALLLEKDPKLTPARVADIIRKTARPLNPSHVSQVDACAAVASVTGGGCGG
jgi:subtilisin family serine protease